MTSRQKTIASAAEWFRSQSPDSTDAEIQAAALLMANRVLALLVDSDLRAMATRTKGA